MKRSILALTLVTLLAACANIPSPHERRMHAESLAAARSWHAERLHGGRFDLAVYLPSRIEAAPVLWVYIEGDGFAWVTPSQPSLDPTPLNPLALRLALAQPQGNAAYLGRPCQFVDEDTASCPQRYWMGARFAREVVEAGNQALDALKLRFGASRLTLVGYSGGGAIAALLAAHRHDVEALVTVAGNLDHRAWTMHHRIEPLSDSLNPANEIEPLHRVWQRHFVGGQDRVIPPALVEGFASRFPGEHRPVVEHLPGFDHQCCWVEAWPTLWQNMAETRAPTNGPGSTGRPRDAVPGPERGDTERLMGQRKSNP